MTPPLRPEPAGPFAGAPPENPVLGLVRKLLHADAAIVGGVKDAADDAITGAVRAPADLVRLIGNTVFRDPSPEEAANPLMQAGRMSRMGNAPGTQMRVTGGPTPQAKAGSAVQALLQGPVHMAQTVAGADTPLRERVHQGLNLAALAAGAYKGAQGLSRAAGVGDEIGALGPREPAPPAARPDLGVLKRMVAERQVEPHEVPAIMRGEAPFVPRAPKFDTGVLTKAFNAREGEQVGTLGDFLVGPKVRALYGDVLDVPVRKLSSPDFHGAFGEYDGRPTIFLDPTADEPIAVLLEEAAHAMRVVGKGRMDAPQLPPSAAGFDPAAYHALPAEQSAARMVQHALGLREDPIP